MRYAVLVRRICLFCRVYSDKRVIREPRLPLRVENIGEGVYKQHTSTRVVRRGYLPQTGYRLGALSQRYPTGSGRSVQKPWLTHDRDVLCVAQPEG